LEALKIFPETEVGGERKSFEYLSGSVSLPIDRSAEPIILNNDHPVFIPLRPFL
jgi:hypothetical protein